MSNKEKILEHLDNFSSENPRAVRSMLSIGLRLNKSLGQEYEIDDLNLDEKLGRFPTGAIPYSLINHALRSDVLGIKSLFGESSCIPFSRVLKAGVGQCLEKAILLQLATQKVGRSYWVSGALELDQETGADFHAFNLVSRGESVYLVDVENPLISDKQGKVIRPYVVPITDISQNGTIIVPKEYRAGRTYCLD